MFSASKSKGASSGYQIANSLRFRSSASAYLSRVITLSATWTLSLWVKRGKLGVTSPIFGSSVGFNSNDTLTAGTLTTTAVYRDPLSWYHIVVSNNGCYINGVSVGSVTTGILVNPSIGNYLTNYFDGYLADIYLIDGSALSATSFGQFNATTGVWGPKQYAGSYGSAGFHLNFSNGTSTTTLGYDSSGNGNNWTTNNISLTAGSTYDWMLDSPTSFAGSSYGVGNYAVLSPITPSVTTTYAPTSGNLNVTLTAQGQAISTIAATSGKWYAELVMSSGTVDTDTGFGFQPPTTYSATFCGSASSLGYVYLADGRKGYNGTFTTYGNTWTLNDVIGVALDLDNGKVYWSKNGTWQASGDPVAGTNAAYTGVSGTFAFVIRNGNSATNNKAFSINFGQRPFSYSPPSGYKSLCTYNLPAPAIANGANYMAATTYTGLGVAQAINNTVNGVYFKPDMVWIKSRSAAQNNSLQDSVRGITLQLSSNLTAAEITSSGEVTALNATGFSLGGDVSGYGTNTAATTYVGWQWKAGGTAVTNTAGSITSSVSANTTSGFSVVTFTAQSSGTGTVGHGLGVAPSMIILKQRAQVGSWGAYHISLGNTQRLLLNTTDAAVTTSTYWNNTSPTSSVFTIGTGFATAGDMVAYCFAAIAGYSAFGSYTGNGSADGPFNYCGFRPRWLMIKRSDASGASWWVLDSSRSTYNVVTAELAANLSDAETSGDNPCDFVANGFKCRSSWGGSNTNGATYIYAAFCENPFQNALAR